MKLYSMEGVGVFFTRLGSNIEKISSIVNTNKVADTAENADMTLVVCQ